ncbi:hypothetical protein [Streptomyces sp. NPDC059169]|uniref:hypothetical protein n=1 Tax=unclassified Streptomyces TaxID=2593676 RepID=UPI00367E1BDB
MERTGTTRRRALMATGAAAAAALTGCSPDGRQDRPTAPSAADKAAAVLRRRSTAASRALLAEYDAALGTHPGLSGRLTPLRTAVAAHVTALSAGPPPTATGTPAPAADPAPSASPGGTSVPVADVPSVLRALAAAERRTSDAHTAALVGADAEYARLLASVAAAGAAHAYLLTEGARS